MSPCRRRRNEKRHASVDGHIWGTLHFLDGSNTLIDHFLSLCALNFDELHFYPPAQIHWRNETVHNHHSARTSHITMAHLSPPHTQQKSPRGRHSPGTTASFTDFSLPAPACDSCKVTTALFLAEDLEIFRLVSLGLAPGHRQLSVTRDVPAV